MFVISQRCLFNMLNIFPKHTKSIGINMYVAKPQSTLGKVGGINCLKIVLNIGEEQVNILNILR